MTQNVDGLVYDLTKGLGIEFGPALALPLGAGDRRPACCSTLRRPGSPPFDELEQQMVSLFANQAMLALERAEIQTARRELELLADRDRIARDLHDHVIQRLFAVGLAMESTLGLVKTPTLNDRLSDHVDQVYEVIQEIRTAIFDLQTGPDDGSQLRAVLHQVITDLTADSPIRTTVRMSGPLDTISPRFAQHIEAALRESVSNAVRHAKATTLMITICADSDIVIDVTDDGIGMPVTVGRSGLHNLRTRAQTVGGTCTVESLDEGGTRFIWTAPTVLTRANRRNRGATALLPRREGCCSGNDDQIGDRRAVRNPARRGVPRGIVDAVSRRPPCRRHRSRSRCRRGRKCRNASR